MPSTVDQNALGALSRKVSELEAAIRKSEKAAEDAAALTAEAATFARMVEDDGKDIKASTKVVTALTVINLACALFMLAVMILYATDSSILHV